jgi:uncharacterized repeat protein (TIGR03837 family)
MMLSAQLPTQRWEIFCSVIDNFGDIGICWRLSRQLVAEFQLAVTLWIDDLTSFQQLCPEVDCQAEQQQLSGVDVRLWHSDIDWQQQQPAAVIIEALACTIPFAYQQQMAAQAVKPLWLNLEYLSAESWVEDCHTLGSPQPQLPLDKYFFFPGFTAKTGGLLCEQGLVTALEQFAADREAQQQFWQQLRLDDALQYSRRISLFAYGQQQLVTLFQWWQQASSTTLCLIPVGQLAEQAMAICAGLKPEQPWRQGQLTLCILPFLPQPEYDKLLAACDINFVRGEDSIIRAQWAAKPFIWQIYRQDQQAHLDKLAAFFKRYTANWPERLAAAVWDFWLQWNAEQALLASWQRFERQLDEIKQKNHEWRRQLIANGDLATNLVRFVEKKIIMPRNFS